MNNEQRIMNNKKKLLYYSLFVVHCSLIKSGTDFTERCKYHCRLENENLNFYV